MKRGDKLTLIAIKTHEKGDFTPGPRTEVTVEDDGGDIITVSHPDGIMARAAFIEKPFMAVNIEMMMCSQLTSDGSEMPCVLQLKQDGLLEKIFSNECMTPHVGRKKMKFEYAIPQNVYELWVLEGILRRVQVNWYYGCPHCESICSVRNGCNGCMGIRLEGKRLMRHENCGFIGFQDQFERGCCCACHEPLVEKEYSFLNGPKKCLDCGVVNYEVHPVVTCLHCETMTCPMDEAEEIPVYAYERND